MNRKEMLQQAAVAVLGTIAGAAGMKCARAAEAATETDEWFAMGAMGTRHVWDTPEEDAAWSHLQGPETERLINAPARPLTCAPSDVEAAILANMAYNRSAVARAKAEAEYQANVAMFSGRYWAKNGVDPHPPDY